MKLQGIDIKMGKLQKLQKIALQTAFTLILLTLLIPLLLHHCSKPSPFQVIKQEEQENIELSEATVPTESSSLKCDIFTGEWVRNPEAPYYTNTSCWAIHEHQNCMKYGRPDTDFLKWRWKPDGCELPIFNPFQFLEIVKGKSLAFVGDSVARNQMQSLICLLSRVEYPIDVSYTKDQNRKRWFYESYNFTLATFWSPWLVKATNGSYDPTGQGLSSVYLDEFDNSWTTKIDEFDYLVISGGHWFIRPLLYYKNHQLAGCHYCQHPNVTDYAYSFGYRKAYRTTFKGILSRTNFKGITYFRTYAPSHFEGGEWNKGGNCARRKPFKSNEATLEGLDLDIYLTQVEEFRAAVKQGKNKGMKFRLIDATQASLLRPDGHPSRYGHWPDENVVLYNDCVHWCLPGPIDSWNDFLLEMLKTEGARSKQENQLLFSNHLNKMKAS